MKKVFAMLFMVGLMATGIVAQAAWTVKTNGRVTSNKITKGTNPYYSSLDTVSNTGSDTVFMTLSGDVNFNLGFDVKLISGRCDSFTWTVWANNMTPGLQTGACLSIGTYTMPGNYSNYSYWESFWGQGNPFTNYMIVFNSTNVVPSTVSIRYWLLIGGGR